LSLLAQTLDNCTQIKFEALGYQKKTVEQIVLMGIPRQFYNFLS